MLQPLFERKRAVPQASAAGCCQQLVAVAALLRRQAELLGLLIAPARSQRRNLLVVLCGQRAREVLGARPLHDVDEDAIDVLPIAPPVDPARDVADPILVLPRVKAGLDGDDYVGVKQLRGLDLAENNVAHNNIGLCFLDRLAVYSLDRGEKAPVVTVDERPH